MMSWISAVLAIGLVAALSGTANAQSEPGHDPAAKCAWQADPAPSFPPGSAAIDDHDVVRGYNILGQILTMEVWNIQVHPGYQYGYVSAYDISLGSVTLPKSGARTATYNVVKTADCCQPVRTVKPTAIVNFDANASSYGDASGRAEAATVVFGTNTQFTVTAGAGVTTNSEESGADVEIELPLTGGAKAKVKFKLAYQSSDSSTDSATGGDGLPEQNAPDEEYLISTDETLKAEADGNPVFWAGANAEVHNHYVWIKTVVKCLHCSQQLIDQQTVNAATLGITEGPPAE